MAFALDAKLSDYEVRGVSQGTSKKGNPYRVIRLESLTGYPLEVSCTNGSLFSEVDKLKRGDMVTCDIRAVSGRDRSYVSLMAAPVVDGNSYRA